jgi:hypothetical protein
LRVLSSAPKPLSDLQFLRLLSRITHKINIHKIFVGILPVDININCFASGKNGIGIDPDVFDGMGVLLACYGIDPPAIDKMGMLL